MKQWISIVFVAILIGIGFSGCTIRHAPSVESEESVAGADKLAEEEADDPAKDPANDPANDPADDGELSPGNPSATPFSGQVILEHPSPEEAAANNSTITPKDITLLQFEPVGEGDPIAIMETTAGFMVIRLFPTEAPLAVENFITLAENNYFDGMTYYKIMENFYIESGHPEHYEPTSIYTNSGGHPIPFVTETSLHLWSFRGALVMKNKGIDRPHTNTSEFRIIQASTIGEDWFEQMEEINYPPKVLEAYKEYGGIPGFDSRCTVFGQVIEGLDVLDAIARAPATETYQPKNPVTILNIIMKEHDPATTQYLEPAISSEDQGDTLSDSDVSGDVLDDEDNPAS